MYQWNPALLRLHLDRETATWMLQFTTDSIGFEPWAKGRPSVAAFRYNNLDINGKFPRTPC